MNRVVSPRRFTPSDRKVCFDRVIEYAATHQVSYYVACKKTGVEYYNFQYWKKSLETKQRVDKIVSSQYKPSVEVILVGAS